MLLRALAAAPLWRIRATRGSIQLYGTALFIVLSLSIRTFSSKGNISTRIFSSNNASKGNIERGRPSTGGGRRSSVPSVHSTVPSVQDLQWRHPSCFSPSLWTQNVELPNLQRPGRVELKLLDFARRAEYVRTAGRDAEPPRYDHVGCFVMKARYNCATAANGTFGKLAHDWKLVLRADDTDNRTRRCDLRSFVEDAGGPVGVAQHVLSSRYGRSLSTSTSPSILRPLNVVMFGNSILRQIWEALTCGWGTQLFRWSVLEGGPALSLAALQQRKRMVQRHEMGTLLWSPSSSSLPTFRAEEGCHGVASQGELHHFYAPDVSVPPTRMDCGDNRAMSDFNDTLRVYYTARPALFENVSHVYDDFGLREQDIDVFVLNQFGGIDQQFAERALDANKGVLAWSLYMDDFKKVQERDTGRWLGANNPGIDKSPDPYHGCMPGAPDDEANLLLFLLFHNATILLK